MEHYMLHVPDQASECSLTDDECIDCARVSVVGFYDITLLVNFWVFGQMFLVSQGAYGGGMIGCMFRAGIQTGCLLIGSCRPFLMVFL